MLTPEHLDRIRVAFDDHCLMANVRLILPVTIWDWANWWIAMLTWAMSPVVPMRATRC